MLNDVMLEYPVPLVRGDRKWLVEVGGKINRGPLLVVVTLPHVAIWSIKRTTTAAQFDDFTSFRKNLHNSLSVIPRTSERVFILVRLLLLWVLDMHGHHPL